MPNWFILAWLCLVAPLTAAGLEFKSTTRDVRVGADVRNTTVDFEFTNRSDKPVEITKYDPSCSCMSVSVKDAKLTYAPGESGLIRAVFDLGNLSGTVEKTLTIYVDKDPLGNPSIVLTTRIHIPVVVAVEPKAVTWEIGAAPEPRSIRITMNHDKPVRVTGVTCSSESFKRELKTLEDGKSYELVVTPVQMGAPGMAILRIETDCDIAKHRLQQAFASVRRSVPGNPPAK